MYRHAPEAAVAHSMQAVQVHVQAHQGRKRSGPNAGLLEANEYMNLYKRTMGSATPTISKG